MFDLEKAIRQWQKTLRKNPALEDGYIAELESHLRDDIEYQRQQGHTVEEAFERAVNNIGAPDPIGAEYYKTDTRHISARPPWEAPRWMPGLLTQYWKIAIRKMRRHKGYAVLNIAGLATGLACCMLILLYVQFELSYDTYHPDADRIYRVAKSMRREGKQDDFAATHLMMAPTLRENFTEVEYVVRLHGEPASPVKYGDRMFYEEELGYAEPDIFNIFAMPFLRGDPATALARPNTAVLTQQMAEKYFGDENPIGRTIQIDTRMRGIVDCEITGVVEDIPPNTHVKFSMIMSWETISHGEYMDMGWQSPGNFPTYIKLAPGTDADVFEARIRRLAHQYNGEELDRRGVEYISFLQPLTDIHLYSHLNWELGTPGNPMYVYFFSVVGVLILLIACMNFMNLTTARSANRAGEVGMRKVVGAQRRQLVLQFLSESMLMAAIAATAAVAMVEVSIPYFNDLAGTQFTYTSIMQPPILLGLLGLVLFTGIVAGSYPAFFLSAFRPAGVLKGALSAGSQGELMRKILVVGQFALSIILIIGTIIVYQQLEYMKDRPLGFDKSQKLVIKIPENVVKKENYEQIKQEFLQYAAVTGATFSSSVPGRWMYFWRLSPTGEEAENTRMVNCFQVDHDFFSEYGIELIAGRPWLPEQSSGYIMNEAAVAAFGWKSPEDALTRTINSRFPIIGIARNFHVKGLQNIIEPVGIFLMDEDYRYISLTVNTGNLRETLAFVEGVYRKLFPDKLYDYFFLDTDFDRQYHAEEQIARIFSGFTFLGLFIACLGLFGMASFIAEQRTKEIGIRKVMGASVTTIVVMLSKDFTKWVLAANIIAWPLGYIAMHRWLQDFAYKTEPDLWIFLLAGVMVAAIALITVSVQAVRAAAANPIESLRYE